MLCEITDKRSFWVEDGSALDGKFGDGAPVLATGSFRLVQDVSRLLFNRCGWHASIHCNKDDNCPYILVLWARKERGKPSAGNVRTARLIAHAFAAGLESHHLYRLD